MVTFRNVDLLCQGIRHILKPGGKIIFTLSHPLKDLATKDLGEKSEPMGSAKRYLGRELHKKITGGRRPIFAETLYRRPLSYYVNCLSNHRLYIMGLIEPSTKLMLRGKKMETSIPMYNVIKAVKV